MTTFDGERFSASMGGAWETQALEQQQQNETLLGAARGVRDMDDWFNPPGTYADAVLIGGGPSINKPEVQEPLRELCEAGHPIFAVNDVPAWLCAQGMRPCDYHVVLDPKPTAVRYLSGPPPLDSYVLALAMHPSALDAALSTGVPVWGWRSMPDGHKPMVYGGSTAVGRALPIIAGAGYRTIHLFGADSSYSAADGQMHAYLHHDSDKRIQFAPFGGVPRWTTPNLAAQAWELPHILGALGRGRGVHTMVYDSDNLAGDYLRAAAEGRLDATPQQRIGA